MSVAAKVELTAPLWAGQVDVWQQLQIQGTSEPSPLGWTPNAEVFGTTTPELERLADWPAEQDVQSVAMESTHVYWIPI